MCHVWTFLGFLFLLLVFLFFLHVFIFWTSWVVSLFGNVLDLLDLLDGQLLDNVIDFLDLLGGHLLCNSLDLLDLLDGHLLGNLSAHLVQVPVEVSFLNLIYMFSLTP